MPCLPCQLAWDVSVAIRPAIMRRATLNGLKRILAIRPPPIKYAAKKEDFLAVFGAGVFLVLLGIAVYSIHEGWNVVDAFSFAVCTLTTSSIADPNLMLSGGAIKMFTSFYILIGIGVLVELVRQIGFGYVALRSDHNTAAQATLQERPTCHAAVARRAGLCRGANDVADR